MIGTPGGTPEKQALFFSGPEEFRAWLEVHHETAPELWMGLRAHGGAGRRPDLGLAAYERRREERTGIYAFEVGADDQLPPALHARLAEDPVAAAFWAGATASYRKVVVHWVTSAKREATVESRMAALVEDCRHGRLVKPQRYGEEPTWARRLRAELGLDG